MFSPDHKRIQPPPQTPTIPAPSSYRNKSVTFHSGPLGLDLECVIHSSPASTTTTTSHVRRSLGAKVLGFNNDSLDHNPVSIGQGELFGVEIGSILDTIDGRSVKTLPFDVIIDTISTRCIEGNLAITFKAVQGIQYTPHHRRSSPIPIPSISISIPEVNQNSFKSTETHGTPLINRIKSSTAQAAAVNAQAFRKRSSPIFKIKLSQQTDDDDNENDDNKDKVELNPTTPCFDSSPKSRPSPLSTDGGSAQKRLRAMPSSPTSTPHNKAVKSNIFKSPSKNAAKSSKSSAEFLRNRFSSAFKAVQPSSSPPSTSPSPSHSPNVSSSSNLNFLDNVNKFSFSPQPTPTRQTFFPSGAFTLIQDKINKKKEEDVLHSIFSPNYVDSASASTSISSGGNVGNGNSIGSRGIVVNDGKVKIKGPVIPRMRVPVVTNDSDNDDDIDHPQEYGEEEAAPAPHLVIDDANITPPSLSGGSETKRKLNYLHADLTDELSNSNDDCNVDDNVVVESSPASIHDVIDNNEEEEEEEENGPKSASSGSESGSERASMSVPVPELSAPPPLPETQSQSYSTSTSHSDFDTKFNPLASFKSYVYQPQLSPALDEEEEEEEYIYCSPLMANTPKSNSHSHSHSPLHTNSNTNTVSHRQVATSHSTPRVTQLPSKSETPNLRGVSPYITNTNMSMSIDTNFNAKISSENGNGKMESKHYQSLPLSVQKALNYLDDQQLSSSSRQGQGRDQLILSSPSVYDNDNAGDEDDDEYNTFMSPGTFMSPQSSKFASTKKPHNPSHANTNTITHSNSNTSTTNPNSTLKQTPKNLSILSKLNYQHITSSTSPSELQSIIHTLSNDFIGEYPALKDLAVNRYKTLTKAGDGGVDVAKYSMSGKDEVNNDYVVEASAFKRVQFTPDSEVKGESSRRSSGSSGSDRGRRAKSDSIALSFSSDWSIYADACDVSGGVSENENNGASFGDNDGESDDSEKVSEGRNKEGAVLNNDDDDENNSNGSNSINSSEENDEEKEEDILSDDFIVYADDSGDSGDEQSSWDQAEEVESVDAAILSERSINLADYCTASHDQDDQDENNEDEDNKPIYDASLNAINAGPPKSVDDNVEGKENVSPAIDGDCENVTDVNTNANAIVDRNNDGSYNDGSDAVPIVKTEVGVEDALATNQLPLATVENENDRKRMLVEHDSAQLQIQQLRSQLDSLTQTQQLQQMRANSIQNELENELTALSKAYSNTRRKLCGASAAAAGSRLRFERADDAYALVELAIERQGYSHGLEIAKYNETLKGQEMALKAVEEKFKLEQEQRAVGAMKAENELSDYRQRLSNALKELDVERDLAIQTKNEQKTQREELDAERNLAVMIQKEKEEEIESSRAQVASKAESDLNDYRQQLSSVSKQLEDERNFANKKEEERKLAVESSSTAFSRKLLQDSTEQITKLEIEKVQLEQRAKMLEREASRLRVVEAAMSEQAAIIKAQKESQSGIVLYQMQRTQMEEAEKQVIVYSTQTAAAEAAVKAIASALSESEEMLTGYVQKSQSNAIVIAEQSERVLRERCQNEELMVKLEVANGHLESSSREVQRLVLKLDEINTSLAVKKLEDSENALRLVGWKRSEQLYQTEIKSLNAQLEMQGSRVSMSLYSMALQETKEQEMALAVKKVEAEKLVDNVRELEMSIVNLKLNLPPTPLARAGAVAADVSAGASVSKMAYSTPSRQVAYKEKDEEGEDENKQTPSELVSAFKSTRSSSVRREPLKSASNTKSNALLPTSKITASSNSAFIKTRSPLLQQMFLASKQKKLYRLTEDKTSLADDFKNENEKEN